MSTARAHIFVIDDDPALLRSLERVLGEDFDVTTFLSGRDALRALDGGAAPDLVLCDLALGEMTCFDVIAELRAKRPDLAENVVVMTGSVDDSPAAFWVAKPFTNDALRRTLRRALRHRAASGSFGPATGAPAA